MIFTRAACWHLEQNPLTWHAGMNGSTPFVVIVCKCGEILSLDQYTIEPDGQVRPTVFCTYGCGLDEYIQLEKWDPALIGK